MILHLLVCFVFQSRYNQQFISNREFQQKIHFQTTEIETLKRQIESVQTVMRTLYESEFNAHYFP